ncbi:MAG: cupin domain-containing protein [Flavobacteriales bacterium]|nr:cupin domain-containing protein [Flavobacteriales bacterium]
MKARNTFLICIIFLGLANTSFAQNLFDAANFTPDSLNENVTVHQMCSDRHETSYLIWVKDSVKPHYHAKHTELIYVLQGEGLFYLGSETMVIKKGDYLRIPEGQIHSFKTTSQAEVKVISVQTPEFLGQDRIWVDHQK